MPVVSQYISYRRPCIVIRIVLPDWLLTRITTSIHTHRHTHRDRGASGWDEGVTRSLRAMRCQQLIGRIKTLKHGQIRGQQCINHVAVWKINLPAFFGMLTDRQMLPESHGKQNETKITKWQYLCFFLQHNFHPSLTTDWPLTERWLTTDWPN